MNDNDRPIRLVIIALPPESLASRLGELREELSALSGSRAAQAWPVHLTLRTGALVPPSRLPDWFRLFEEAVRDIATFPIEIGTFVTSHLPASGQVGGGKCFAGFEIMATPRLLQAHRQLAAFDLFRKGEQYAYRPHLTMAFDDLDEAGLGRIREAMAGREQEFASASWTCQRVECWRQNNDQWREAAALPLRMEVHHG